MLQLEMCASVHALLITPKRKDKGKVTCVCTTDPGNKLFSTDVRSNWSAIVE